MHRALVAAGLAASFAATLAACAVEGPVTPPPDGSGDETIVVPPGKADDFFSLEAQEYRVEGLSTVTLEAGFAGRSEDDRLKRARELVTLRQTAIAWFLSQYVREKETGDHGDANASYGGFGALTKNGSYEDFELAQVEGETYSFRFRQLIGGKMDLLELLPTRTGSDAAKHFDLWVGKPTNDELARLETNHEWYRSAPWDAFDPSKVDDARKELLDLSITPEPKSADAWVDTNRLFEDGEVTIGLHFGWDYHSDYHLKHSKEMYEWLTSHGYESPVSSYDAYGPDSGPLARTINASGRPVAVKIWLRWGKPGSVTDPDTDEGGRKLEELMREDFATREVVVFSGHSGPFYAFALANWRKTEEGDLDDSEISGLELLQGYQVVLAEGCNTYAVGQGFWDNPSKPNHKDIDIVTTTSFSNASSTSTVRDFVDAIVGTDSNGRHVPRRFGELLDNLAGGGWFDAMYGVHGIDDNPHLHPYANLRKLCTPCSSDTACGGTGNVCARLPDASAKVCTATCSADDGCPSGFNCVDTAQGRTLNGKVCVPATLSCEHQTGEERATLVLNELGASPPSGAAGDWNADGLRDARADEFVELVNPGAEPVRVGGFTISDGTGVRFTFPEGSTIPAYGAAVVFGGGAPPTYPGALVFVARAGLSLNDAGDTITVSDERGARLDQATYGGEAGAGSSLAREVDGDAGSPLAPHGGPTATPGARADGSPFGG